MLLSLVLILLLIWAAVVGALYSNFIVFYKSFSETDSYNKAYYASIAALERWELVTKQREPGYVWSGWWKWMTDINATYPDYSGFSYLVQSDDTSLLRDVNSRTNRVPREWEWDVDWMLATWDSVDYNKMDYENAEVFLLYVDNLAESPYKKKSCLNVWDCDDVRVSISWQIRLPPKMRTTFWPLDTSKSRVYKIGTNNAEKKNDEIVDWQIRWNYEWTQFTIFSMNKQYCSDSVIKESDINETVDLSFWWEKKWQPNKNKRESNPVVVWSKADDISRSDLNSILKDGNENMYSRLNLRLSLLNILQSVTSGMIYPYLEYYLNFDNDVADKYFKINGEWKYKDYQVNIIMYKPTVKESVLWNFTAIF